MFIHFKLVWFPIIQEEKLFQTQVRCIQYSSLSRVDHHTTLSRSRVFSPIVAQCTDKYWNIVKNFFRYLITIILVDYTIYYTNIILAYYTIYYINNTNLLYYFIFHLTIRHKKSRFFKLCFFFFSETISPTKKTQETFWL